MAVKVDQSSGDAREHFLTTQNNMLNTFFKLSAL